MSNFYEDVAAFNAKFGLSIYPEYPPGLLEEDVYQYRINFLFEELREFDRAHHARDLAGAADALVDLVYVALGTAHLMGLPFNELWLEVQRANLTKERASGTDDSRSKRGHRLDVVKTLGWRPPDLKSILRNRLSTWGLEYPKGDAKS